MELGHCPRCATPYSASEVTGFGVIRGRTASAGGPRIEYRCQACNRVIHLIAHGEGRYAPPGEPPPPPVPESERLPPWLTGETARERRQRAREQEPQPTPTAAAATETAPPAPEPEREPAQATETEAAGDEPLPGVTEAFEILGVAPTAPREEIDRAFRERSRTCHPDKVAHLDPEFQELAERKFRRLQRAYLLLVG